jgi:hypothetical protein
MEFPPLWHQGMVPRFMILWCEVVPLTNSKSFLT